MDKVITCYVNYVREKKKLRLNIYKEELLVWYGRINYYVSKLNFDVVCHS